MCYNILINELFLFERVLTMDEKLISPSAFSKCELLVEIDGNELHVPINFGMTDDEVRKIYPHLLSISRVEDNPMLSYDAMKESGKLDEYPDELRERYEKWAKRMSHYWYNKPSTSLLDVAIGLAIDMKFNGVMLGDIIDPPETSYEGSMENPMNPDPELITDEEVEAIERKFGIGPNANAEVTLSSEIQPHDQIAGNVDVGMYGNDSEYDFVSKELDEMEADATKQDKFAAIIEEDYNATDKTKYEMTYRRGRKFDDSQINNEGILQMYGNNDMFTRIEHEMMNDEEEDTDEGYSDDEEDEDDDEDMIGEPYYEDDEEPNVIPFGEDDDL